MPRTSVVGWIAAALLIPVCSCQKDAAREESEPAPPSVASAPLTATPKQATATDKDPSVVNRREPTPPPEPMRANPGAPGPPAKLVPNGEARVGNRTTCLVDQQEFLIEPSSPKVERNGRTYYFHGPDCLAKFNAEPDKYPAAP